MKTFILSMVSFLFFAVMTVSVSGFAASENASPTQLSPKTNQAGASLSGKVVETMTSGGYTYALIEKNGQKTWVAVPAVNITVGQEVSFIPGVEMGDFESKTLKRKFDNIIFSPGLFGQAPTESKATAVEPNESKNVEKAQGPNAYTINELIANSAGLDKHEVVVRGKVVKVSEHIMGKNWIHIKDGSGPQQEKIVVTSENLPKVGDVVTVSGTLHKDRDFGSGYKYSVIIEDATIK